METTFDRKGERLLPNELHEILNDVSAVEVSGIVSDIKNNIIYATGLSGFVSIGSVCKVEARMSKRVWMAEVVEIHGKKAMLLPFLSTVGIPVFAEITLVSKASYIYPHETWLGRVLDHTCKPIDQLGPLISGPLAYSLRNTPPNGSLRRRVVKPLTTGIRVIDTLVPCCIGQRMGVFASPGLGKSMLLANITRYIDADVIIVGLIGERGREAREFIEDYLGEDGLRKAIIVLATSDMPPLAKKYAAYSTLAIAEYFRDQGKKVLCIIDSITRFAMAQREIGLTMGEMPAARGYTPSMYSELQQLLERAGPGIDEKYDTSKIYGDITGLFSVLTDGEDDPVMDAVRSILDGHIILSAELANRNIFPAIDILKSLSRMTPQCYSLREYEIVKHVRQYYSLYHDMRDAIRLGIYKSGSNKEIDEAIRYASNIEKFILQGMNRYNSRSESFALLAAAIDFDDQAVQNC